MARNTYVLIPTNKSNGVPMLKIRNAERRNQRRLNKRIARFEMMHGQSFSYTTTSGTRVVVPTEYAEALTVKRDAERKARTSGLRMVTVTA